MFPLGGIRLDAGGKGGTIRKLTTALNPQGMRIESFQAPAEEELAHDFLWRVHRKMQAWIFNCPR